MNDIEFYQVISETDIEELAGMAKLIWIEHFTSIIGESQVTYMLDKFQSVSALTSQIKDGYQYYILVCGGEKVGYTGFHVEHEKVFLSKLYIEKKYRGNHYASAVMQFLSKIAREHQLSGIWLTVNKRNNNTIEIYRHMGFFVAREQKADIGNGFYMDDYIMEMPIEVE